MKSHFELEDKAFEQQFRDGILDPAIFNHEAHLRLAWIHIQKYGVEKAIANICEQLLGFVKHLGAEEKYNKTLTIAAIKAVNHFIQKSYTDNFLEFIQQYPRLKNNFREIIACHYKQNIFNSELARQEYLEPDILPFI